MRSLAFLRNSLAIIAASFIPSVFAGTSSFNLTPGVTPISRDIYWLHMVILGICVIIGIIVFGIMAYSLVKHRKAAGHKAKPMHGSLKLEIVWVIIPFLILVVMAIPATIVLTRMTDNSKAQLNIKIVGYQWKWKYEYLDQGISFFSNLSTPRDQIEGKAKRGKWYLLEVDKPLVLPIHKKIRFLLTSNDVIHSWWVPALGVKRDAIPGFVHESWARIEKPGTYRGQCAELCGVNHAFMPIVVKAVTEEDFEKWVAQHTGTATASTEPAKDMTKEALIALGQEVYGKYCSVCHKPNGVGMPPAFPALKGSKMTVGPAQDHINIVLNGKNGTAMQAFSSQLSNQEIAAVITYERNAWGNSDQTKYGNNAGGIVQPAQVKKLRGEGKSS